MGTIFVSSALQQEEIKELLKTFESGEFGYKFLKKEGLKLYYEVTGDPVLAARYARERIKETAWGKVLYFQAQAG